MSVERSAEWYREEFSRLAGELDRLPNRERKFKHLQIRRVRIEIRASRLVVGGVNGGYFDSFPAVRENLRVAWTGELSGNKGTITVDPNGKSHVCLDADVAPDDGKPLPITECSDLHLASLWVFPIVQVLQTIQRDRFEGFSGKYNFKTMKTDVEGRPIGKDGKPLKFVKSETIDPKTGQKLQSWKRGGEFTYVGDDYDDADAMALEVNRVVDSASACRALADMLPIGTQQPSPSTEGPHADEITITEASNEYDVPMSAWSKAAMINSDAPGHLPTRKVGRNRYVPRRHAKSFAANYSARREQRSVRRVGNEP